MAEKLNIFGAGGFGRELAAWVRALPGWEIESFYDDGKAKDSLVDGIRVAGGVEDLLAKSGGNVVIAVADPSFRRRISETLGGRFKYPVLIHPSSILTDPQKIHLSEGTVIAAGCILTTAIQIGPHSIINLNCTIGHDTAIGGYSSVMPGVNVAGEVFIGTGVFIGSGVNIINGVKVGDRSVIGAGAVVVQSVPAGVTAVGVPARAVQT